METLPRTPYPSDVGDDEWAFLAPYLTLMAEDAPQRRHSLRELFNGLRFITRGGLQWRLMPHDLSSPSTPGAAWRRASPRRSSMIYGRCCASPTAESGARAGYDGAKRRKGSKVHAAVDTLGQRLALRVTPARPPWPTKATHGIRLEVV